MTLPDDSSSASILELFRRTGALLQGHFILRSGLHSRVFFQCALLLQDATIASEVCGRLAELARPFAFDTVISPAVGGLIVGQEVARHLGKRHIFVEKDDHGRLVLRRGFVIHPGEKFFVAEDVVTKGGRLQETMEIVRAAGGEAVAAGSLVDRSGGHLPDIGCPFVRLLALEVETFPPESLPADLAAIPPVKPGSK